MEIEISEGLYRQGFDAEGFKSNLNNINYYVNYQILPPRRPWYAFGELSYFRPIKVTFSLVSSAYITDEHVAENIVFALFSNLALIRSRSGIFFRINGRLYDRNTAMGIVAQAVANGTNLRSVLGSEIGQCWSSVISHSTVDTSRVNDIEIPDEVINPNPVTPTNSSSPVSASTSRPSTTTRTSRESNRQPEEPTTVVDTAMDLVDSFSEAVSKPISQSLGAKDNVAGKNIVKIISYTAIGGAAALGLYKGIQYVSSKS